VTFDWNLLLDFEPAPDIPYPYEPRRCQRCGRFCKTLKLVYTGGPVPEPDYEVGECCA
jgi:hypothetical protein